MVFCGYEGWIPVYAHKTRGKKGRMTSLTVKSPNPSAEPLFYALPFAESVNQTSSIVPLYEYRHADTEQRLYSIQARLDKKEWIRTKNPLCRVWKAPANILLLDGKAKPAAGY